jgi:hypothetical protein
MTRSSNTFSPVIIALAATIVAALAGCSSPAPMPKKTAVACSSTSATISWKGKTRVDDAPLGSSVVVVVVVVSADLVEETQRTALDPQPTFLPDTITVLADVNSSSIRNWKTAFLPDVRRTGQVSTTFGAHATLPEKTPVALDNPTTSTYITDVALNQWEVPFTIDCAGSKPVPGTIRAAEIGDTASRTVKCGVAPANPSDPSTIRAEKLCPAYGHRSHWGHRSHLSEAPVSRRLKHPAAANVPLCQVWCGSTGHNPDEREQSRRGAAKWTQDAANRSPIG